MLRVEAAGLALQFAPDEILDIRAGSARFTSLAGIKPLEVKSDGSHGIGPRFVMDGTSSGAPMSLGGQTIARGIGIMAGTSVTFELEGKFNALLGRFGVPDGVAPASSVQLVAAVDGNEVYRSAWRTSVDEPVEMLVNLGRGRKLTVKVESAGGSVVGASGLLGEPALVR
jgi:hypothetical protein